MIISGLYEADYNGVMRTGTNISKRWRELEDGKWVRKEEIITDFEPYLYVPSSEKLFITAKDGHSNTSFASLLEDDKNVGWMVERVEKTSKKSADGRMLSKVVLKGASMVRQFARRVKPTFEGDVPYEDRYLIDRESRIDPNPMRLLFIDLEALQFREGDIGPAHYRLENHSRDFQEINLIAAYDSFSKSYVQWCQHPNFDESVEVRHFEAVRGDKPVPCVVYFFDTEKKLLESFVEFVEDIDPDCLLAWGMDFYDLPTLYHRLESVGIGAERLSPPSLGSERYFLAPRIKGGQQYTWRAQPVSGRIVVPLDKLFERVYRDSKSANLPSNKLDVVGQKLFNRGKTEFRPDFYDADYDTFIEDYLFYNFRDVELMVQIEEDYNLINGQQKFQELAMCEFSATLTGSAMARVFFMREADFIQKTGWQDYDEDEELQGAIIMDPEEMNTIGLHKNVVILDFAGLYPSMMVAYNTSFETKVKPGEERDDDIIGDGCRFRRSPMGLLPKCVIKLDKLRDEYKALRQAAAEEHGKSSLEYRKWDDAQKSVKRLRATFYGLMGFGRKGYAWGDIDIARTITYGGRTNLRRIQEECESLGYPVIYGHTDSIFVKLGDDKTVEECAEIAEMLGERLTKICQDALKSTAVEVEPELIMDRFYLPRRNKYAGRIVWQPGTGATPFDIGGYDVDSRIKMQGLEAKHTNTAMVGREVQLESLKMIWDDCPANAVFDYIKNLVDRIIDGDVPVEDLIAGGRLGQWLTNFSERETPKYEGSRAETHHPRCNEAGSYVKSVKIVNGKEQKKYCKCSRWYGVPEHYLAGSTNRSAHPGADEQDKCYSHLSGEHKGVAWHNIVLANDRFPTMDKGDTFSWIFVKDGPTWFPTDGYVAFHEIEQIGDYEIDYLKLAISNVVDKVDHILYGLGLSNQDLLPNTSKFAGRELSLEDFQ